MGKTYRKSNTQKGYKQNKDISELTHKPKIKYKKPKYPHKFNE